MNIIAYDLGTGGVKASLYNNSLKTLAKVFIEYETFYPAAKQHEQRPVDWWEAVQKSTQTLLKKSNKSPNSIKCVSLSGHSLVSVPIDKNGLLLQDQVPIWSDTRATDEANDFFTRINEREWYETTGNGFPPACYPIFKLMWLKKHKPEIFSKIYKVLGSKDYINFLLTDNYSTDNSYASGTGAYNLFKASMEDSFLKAAEISSDIFPSIVPSHTIVGHITAHAAEKIGLQPGTAVACGGVDNACMALGAVGSGEGKVYTSLGSSSWIPVNSSTPILDFNKKPYVFAHIQENMFTSAFSIFSGGSSLRWAKDTLCKNIEDNENSYDKITELAQLSPAGSNGVLFNPSLAGGTSQEKSINIQGAYLGLTLSNTQNDLLRATLEGITLNLKKPYDFMHEKTEISNQILICGGGSKSPFWLQLFADIFETKIIKTNIDQDAASLGAAAIAARAIGIWQEYSRIDSLHKVEFSCEPNKNNFIIYRKLYDYFQYTSSLLSDIGDYMQQ